MRQSLLHQWIQALLCVCSLVFFSPLVIHARDYQVGSLKSIKVKKGRLLSNSTAHVKPFEQSKVIRKLMKEDLVSVFGQSGVFYSVVFHHTSGKLMKLWVLKSSISIVPGQPPVLRKVPTSIRKQPMTQYKVPSKIPQKKTKTPLGHNTSSLGLAGLGTLDLHQYGANAYGGGIWVDTPINSTWALSFPLLYQHNSLFSSAILGISAKMYVLKKEKMSLFSRLGPAFEYSWGGGQGFWGVNADLGLGLRLKMGINSFIDFEPVSLVGMVYNNESVPFSVRYMPRVVFSFGL